MRKNPSGLAVFILSAFLLPLRSALTRHLPSFVSIHKNSTTSSNTRSNRLMMAGTPPDESTTQTQTALPPLPPPAAAAAANKDKDRQAAIIWNRFAQKYSQRRISDEATYQKKLEMTRQYLRPHMEHVLEIACGTGGTSLLHAPYVGRILATDVSSGMLEIARTRAKETGVTNVDFQEASVGQLQQQLPNNSQDVVLGFSILHLLPNRLEAICQVHSWLKPNGTFVTSTMCAGDLSCMTLSAMTTALRIGQFFGVLPAVQAFTQQGLKEEFVQAGFVIEQEWQLNKGSPVFLVGRKI